MNVSDNVTPSQTGQPRAIPVTPHNQDSPNDTTELTEETREGRVTPPGIRDAIDSISDYEFDPTPDVDEALLTQLNEQQENDALEALMMYGVGSTPSTLPTLQTEAWPYEGQIPNPISIHKARRLLAAGYAAIPCEINGTDIHGYAWMIETPEEWAQRAGVLPTIVVPTKPLLPTDYVLKEQYAYNRKMTAFKEYNHLMQEGRMKLITWFGRAMFNDLYKNDMLPPAVTPRELLEHLAETYSQGTDNRHHMERVKKDFESDYNPKLPVETYFMKLQDARAQAVILGQGYTEQQAMNQALSQFDKHLGKDAHKAEKRWYRRTKENESTDWNAFKTFWKDEVHQWSRTNKSTHQAHQAVTNQVDTLTAMVNDLQVDLSTMQGENRSYQAQNNALVARQVEFHKALQAEQYQRRDDMSALTDNASRFAAMNAGVPYGSFTTGTGSTPPGGDTNHQNQQLLLSAKQRAPDAYKHMNEGRGKKFNKYCWHCGVNTSHWTRRCYELTDEQKKTYKDASFTNRMGGSAKFLDRRDKYQVDFNFDSL